MVGNRRCRGPLEGTVAVKLTPVTTVPSRRHRTEWIALVLRQSSLGLMNATNNAHYAHPAFWARFVVVGGGGEGGRGRKRVRGTGGTPRCRQCIE
jgi:hypothetical protein